MSDYIFTGEKQVFTLKLINYIEIIISRFNYLIDEIKIPNWILFTLI